jgi:sulfide dehydrogenase cytochrome subunit
MKVFQSCTTLISLILWAPLQAADVATLKLICESCHGQGGVSVTASVPTIAGQAYTFIEDNLLAYRVNDRPCTAGPSDDGGPFVAPSPMCAIASTLDDEAIEMLAEYYEQQEFVAAKQGFDESLARQGAEVHIKGNCELCHSQGGQNSNGMAAILAGQWTPYLEIALHQIRSGQRMGPKVMNRAIKALTDEEIRALLNFYASKQ